jgi:hypothetical protein
LRTGRKNLMRWSLCYLQAMVSIKEAVQSAIVFAQETLGAERTKGLRLEEVESADVNGADAWLITLSMLVPDPLADQFPFSDRARDYKVFTVLKNTGEVTAIRIRELATT